MNAGEKGPPSTYQEEKINKLFESYIFALNGGTKQIKQMRQHLWE